MIQNLQFIRQIKWRRSPYFGKARRFTYKGDFPPENTVDLNVMIFGSNTDVGKTIISSGLCRASLQHGSVCYIKPIQTGKAYLLPQ